MLRYLLALFFGCPHSKTTFPMTVTARSVDGEVRRRTYVACLHCGEEIDYNWQTMQTEGTSHGAGYEPNVVPISQASRAFRLSAHNRMARSR